MKIWLFFHIFRTFWCLVIDDFSILEFQGRKGQKGRSDSYNYKLAHLDVKSSKHTLPTFRGNFYTTQKANLDGEVAYNHFKANIGLEGQKIER